MRVISRLFAATLALVLLAVSILALVEITLALFLQSPWLIDSTGWFDTLTSDTWSSPGVRGALLAFAAAGLILLLVAWAPRPVVAVPTELDHDQALTMTVRRRDFQSRVEARVRDLPYITAATATASSRQIEVIAQSTRGATPEIRAAVESTVRATASQVGLDVDNCHIRVRKSAGRAA